ncbi:MAG: hypothetical protein AAGK14_04670 [Verrucomicrobiota bacterium]
MGLLLLGVTAICAGVFYNDDASLLVVALAFFALIVTAILLAIYKVSRNRD